MNEIDRRIVRQNTGRMSQLLLDAFQNRIAAQKQQLLASALARFQGGESDHPFLLSFFSGYAQLDQLEEDLIKDIQVMNHDNRKEVL